MFRGDANVDVKQAEVTEVDVATRTVTTADGLSWTGDYLVLAMGAQPNFYRTSGAAEHGMPLYSLLDAERLRSRIIEVFDAADRDPRLIDRGALTFVVVGGGATGVEITGALADFVNTVVPEEYHDLAVHQTRIHLVDHGNALLAPFSDKAHEYAAKVLQRDGVRLHLGTGVEEVTPAAVRLEGGITLPTRCVIWAGGVQATDLAAGTGLARGRGGRLRSGTTCPSTERRRCSSSATSPPWTGRTGRPIRSSGRWRCSRGSGRRRTSGPTWPASRAARSTTTTRGSWP
jgi:NADH:ubiquinone reductase (H+-translocating)